MPLEDRIERNTKKAKKAFSEKRYAAALKLYQSVEKDLNSLVAPPNDPDNPNVSAYIQLLLVKIDIVESTLLATPIPTPTSITIYNNESQFIVNTAKKFRETIEIDISAWPEEYQSEFENTKSGSIQNGQQKIWDAIEERSMIVNFRYASRLQENTLSECRAKKLYFLKSCRMNLQLLKKYPNNAFYLETKQHITLHVKRLNNRINTLTPDLTVTNHSNHATSSLEKRALTHGHVSNSMKRRKFFTPSKKETFAMKDKQELDLAANLLMNLKNKTFN